jgi:inner membrane protein
VDTITHAMLGAALAHAAAPRHPVLRVRERLALGAAAGAFPDVDFGGFLLFPLSFLADWHQGPTHSLVLLPMWAAAVAATFCALTRQASALADAFRACALGLASHIAADAITAYGAAIFYPLSAIRVGLGMTYVVDPLFSLIIFATLFAARREHKRLHVAIGLAVLCLYVATQTVLQRQAVQIGSTAARVEGLALNTLTAFAQPFSPFNWKLIGTGGEHHYEAYINIASHRPLVPRSVPWFGEIAAAYRSPGELRWRPRHRYGDRPELHALVRERWDDPRLEPFRRFAAYPAVSRIDTDTRETCVWFTDLRYDLPALPDVFRFGFCRDGPEEPWQLYRLEYLSERSRQKL